MGKYELGFDPHRDDLGPGKFEKIPPHRPVAVPLPARNIIDAGRFFIQLSLASKHETAGSRPPVPRVFTEFEWDGSDLHLIHPSRPGQKWLHNADGRSAVPAPRIGLERGVIYTVSGPSLMGALERETYCSVAGSNECFARELGDYISSQHIDALLYRDKTGGHTLELTDLSSTNGTMIKREFVRGPKISNDMPTIMPSRR